MRQEAPRSIARRRLRKYLRSLRVGAAPLPHFDPSSPPEFTSRDLRAQNYICNSDFTNRGFFSAKNKKFIKFFKFPFPGVGLHGNELLCDALG